MSAVSEEIVTTIKRLQTLKSLSSFSLGGGTNLALRFKHRESIDIDLFTDQIVGQEGFKSIREEIESFFLKMEFFHLIFHVILMINIYSDVVLSNVMIR